MEAFLPPVSSLLLLFAGLRCGMRVTFLDNEAGNALGWNPNGVTTAFTITESEVGGGVNSGLSASSEILLGINSV